MVKINGSKLFLKTIYSSIQEENEFNSKSI